MSQIPVSAPFLLYNGSAAYDFEKSQLLLPCPIDLDPWDTMDRLADRFPWLNVEVQGLDYHYSYKEYPKWDWFYSGAGYDHICARRGQSFDPFLKFSMMGEIREQNVGHFFGGSPEEIAAMDEVEKWLNDTFGEKVEVFRSAQRIIDVHAKGVSKAKAARNLQAELGKKILVCVGDAENDRNMLQEADYAYCTADGALHEEFPNVCACALGAVADAIYEKIPRIP